MLLIFNTSATFFLKSHQVETLVGKTILRVILSNSVNPCSSPPCS